MVNSIARRDGPRLDVRLHVRWTAGLGKGEAEASDVSPRGLRLESEQEVTPGTQMEVVVDTGDQGELTAVGLVMWCRPHLTPTQRTVYDVGVRFDAPWATEENGALGRALARVFAMGGEDHTATWAKTGCVLRAGAKDAVPLVLTEVAVGNLQFRAGAPLNDMLQSGRLVRLSVTAEGAEHALEGRVMWLVVQGPQTRSSTQRAQDTFGVELLELDAPQKALLERMRLGQTVADQVRISA